MNALLAGSLLSLSLFASPLLADDAAAGFQLESLLYPGQALTQTLENGSILAFDGIDIGLFASNGVPIQVLASLPSFVFGSFLKLSPNEDFALLGESSGGALLRIELDGSAFTQVTSLNFNYDAVFESQSSLIVSAATGGFGLGNDLVRVDLNTGLCTFLAHLSGASGPLAIDAGGNLFYGTVSDAFPAPAASSQILRFDAAQLTGTPLLQESDALLYSTGFSNASALAFDALHNDLFLAEVNSSLGINQIRLVGSDASQSPVLLLGDAGNFLSNLEFKAGDGIAKLRAFQPEVGGTLYYNSTDFFSSFQRQRMSPLRASLFLSGPGSVGPGQVDLEVFDGLPNGSALIFFGPSGQVLTPELVINLKRLDFPLFFGLSPASVQLVPGLLQLDGTGYAKLSMHNPGGLNGMLAVQVMLSQNPGPVGTSNLALL